MNTLDFANNLKRIREMKGVSKSELGRRIGVSDVTIGYWESGKNEPRMGKIEMIADVLGVTTDDLLFDSPVQRTLLGSGLQIDGKSGMKPLYGSIAAGMPLEMIKVDEYIEVPEYITHRYPTAFLLKVNGDSMNKVVPNGAYALIEPCEEASNGEVVAVIVNGSDATLKRFYKLQNTLVLEPDSYNSEYSTKMFDCNKDDCRVTKIIGKMVWFMSPYNVKY